MTMIMTMQSNPAANVTKQPSNQQPGVVTGVPNLLLRLEAAALLAGSITAYAYLGASWWLFAALFFVPDVFMLGYLRSVRLGAVLYNIGHTTVTPALVILTGYLLQQETVLAVGVIWLGHIGFDRIVGYGLKYATHFQHTHLGTPFAK